MEVIARMQFVDALVHAVAPGAVPSSPWAFGPLGASSSSEVRLPQAIHHKAIARSQTDSTLPFRHFWIAGSFPSMRTLPRPRIVHRSSPGDGHDRAVAHGTAAAAPAVEKAARSPGEQRHVTC